MVHGLLEEDMFGTATRFGVRAARVSPIPILVMLSNTMQESLK